MLIFALVSLLQVLTLVGSGYLVLKFAKLTNHRWATEAIANAIVAGIIVNFFVFLAVKNLAYAIVLQGIFGVVGLWLGRKAMLEMANGIVINKPSVLGHLFLFLLYFSFIVLLPVQDWDAKSSWFFHAKIMFFEGGLLNQEFLTFRDAHYAFAQFDYPKLFSWLSTFGPQVLGVWNEHLPKLGIVPLFLVFQLSLGRFSKDRFGFWFLIISFLLGFHKYFWNGYMDGYVAVYASVGVLFVMNYFLEGDLEDFYSGIMILGLGSFLKNEGAVLALLTALMILGLLLKNGNLRIFVKQEFRRLIALAVIFLAPQILWIITKKHYGLAHWLDSSEGPVIDNFTLEGFFRISKSLIYDGLIMRSWLVLGVVVLFAWYIKGRSFRWIKLAPALLSVVYLGVLYIVFLKTPFNLAYHLWTTNDRVSFAVRGLVFASCFLILKKSNLQKS